MNFEPRHQPLDRRTRKRIATMQHIQRVALDMFDARGYDTVTITQIAEAADVGERSIYRYFGTKHMLVLHDEADQLAVEAFADHVRDHTLLDAARATLDSIEAMLADETTDALRRLTVVHEHPELQAAVALYTEQLGDALGTAIANIRGRPADEFSARVHGRCIITALAAAIDNWYRNPQRGPLINELHRAIDSLTTLNIR